MVLFPPPFYFVFDISNHLSYLQNNFSYELARPIMGTIFLVSHVYGNSRLLLYMYICTSVSNTHARVSVLRIKFKSKETEDFLA